MWGAEVVSKVVSRVVSKDEIFQLISRIMVDRFDFDAEQIVGDAFIVEDLDLDSLDTMDLALELEEETGVDLDLDELKTVRQVSDIVNVIHRGLGPGSA
jgi:acyl carrier protein